MLTIAQIVKFVMASASEAKLGAMFITAQAMVSQGNTFEEMGWKQPRSPIHKDYSAAADVVNNTIVPRKLKAMDRCLYWLWCRNSQGQFRYYWSPGLQNWSNYRTNHHPPIYNELKRTPFAGLKVHRHDVQSEPILV